MFYFIRHGQSNFNVVRNKMKSMYKQQYYLHDEWTKVRFHEDHVDSPLSEKGIKQAQECRIKMQDQNIDVVVVSPLRRTLQTCDIIFKDHKSKPEIIVDPNVREYMQSSCDIGARLGQLMKQYDYFNFQKVKDPETWYLHSIHDEQRKNTILDKLSGLEGAQKNQQAKKHGFQYIKWLQTVLWDDILLQKYFYQKKRAQLNYFLIQYAQNYKNKNIVIVSHSQNIKAYFNISPNNCQIIKKNVKEIEQMI